MKPYKKLENDLHALAEEITQGKYGRESNVDIEALRDDIEVLLDEYEGADEDDGEDQDLPGE